MKAQEIAVYREIQRNTDMAMKAIEALNDKVSNDSLAMQISRQSLRYSEIYNEATKHLVESGVDSYRSSYIADAMLWSGVQYNTFLNASTGHIAEMMIKGSNNGIMEMEKVLKHNEGASESTKGLAMELIDFEQKNVKRLQDYL